MFGLLYASLKYFALGLVIGLLTAPRTGSESRQLLRERGWSAARDMLSSFESRRGRATTGE